MLNIILAGVLGIPCLVVAAGVAPVIALLSVPSLLLLLFQTDSSSESDKVVADHVIITGGSSGIGLSIAKECVKRGVAKITLVARNMEKLQEAKKELEAMSAATKVSVVSASVSDYDALAQAAKDLKIVETDRVVLWNCAGFAFPTEFLKIPVEKFEAQIKTNQLGAIYVVRAFLPHMNKGCIVFTSSALGQLGIYGHTAYSPTKFALRGFAESLHHELILTHPEVSVQLAFPTDTDTPGYQEELKITPEITKKISESGGLVHPDDTAKAMVGAAFRRHPPFNVYFNFEGWMLATVTSGMSPVSSLPDAVSQVALGGILRMVGLFFLNDWWNTIRGYRPSKKED
eukprot:Nitzschia sp. Nitz4//scaffold291_size36643//6474//7604//NITZ4_007760-RA/size36643-snap-gene-0.28-mRNA-1//-1//CDS//3329546118//1446//frame0